MRIILTVSLLLLIASCGGDGKSRNSTTSVAPLTETDLSGTWVRRETSETYSKETGEYLYTTVADSILIIRDDALGTAFNGCLSHGFYTDSYVIKAEKNLYWGTGIYSPNQDGTLEYQGEMESDPYYEDLQYRTNSKLIRIFNDENLDFGTIAVDGGITLYEDTRVCYERVTHSHLPYQYFTLRAPITPFDGDYFYIYARIRNDTTPGVYSYDDRHSANEIFLEVSCTSQECNDADFSPSPTDVTVTLTNLTPERITGSFSFTDQFGSELDYTGEFDIFPPQLP